jgi:hypothetical protein
MNFDEEGVYVCAQVLGIKPRALHMLNRHSPTNLHSRLSTSV